MAWNLSYWNPIRRFLENHLITRPEINPSSCEACGICSQHCPPQAISEQNGRMVIDRKKCISCFCCHELCSNEAVQIVLPRFGRFLSKNSPLELMVFPMDLPILQKFVQELSELLPGRFITRIHQPLPRDIVLRTRAHAGPEIKLMISADLALGRIHITDLKIPNPQSPPRFCAFLRAHFQGSRIIRVEFEPDDRVVRIVAQKGPEAARVRRELILEALGRIEHHSCGPRDQ